MCTRRSGISIWERVCPPFIWVRSSRGGGGNSETEERGETGWLKFSRSPSSFSSALREPLLTRLTLWGRLSNPPEQSHPGTSAKTHAGSPLWPLLLPSYKEFSMHPLQDVASQELHCWMTNGQMQTNLFLFPGETTYRWGGVGPQGGRNDESACSSTAL